MLLFDFWRNGLMDVVDDDECVGGGGVLFKLFNVNWP